MTDLAIVDVHLAGVGADMYPHQALAALLADHVHTRLDVLDGFRIAESLEVHLAQQPAVQVQFEKARRLVGHADQGMAIRIEAQCRDVGDALANGARFHGDTIARQPQRAGLTAFGLELALDVEPEPLEQPVLLGHQGQAQQQRGTQQGGQGTRGEQRKHRQGPEAVMPRSLRAPP